MNDCELLELSAKAAGIKLPDGIWHFQVGQVILPKNAPFIWNPLINDCHALRLAVDLSFHIRVMRRCIMVEMRELHDDVMEPHGIDRRAATRRAIVRAAAIIGKAMP